ncbi:Protein kinase domain-containing protein [Plasmodiophora brassicae]|uniref:Protein kinase domain-containing protein n=1 Tax=Plasmodiophora brassicae TaxID=37360 RepID=A0A0G4IQ82_PLABS|nr:hypothetical protein PBRA_000717 [Plasmodiophora brassicae]SPQ97682.1 unnamed protein product [Plasmodiophora brassicae]
MQDEADALLGRSLSSLAVSLPEIDLSERFGAHVSLVDAGELQQENRVLAGRARELETGLAAARQQFRGVQEQLRAANYQIADLQRQLNDDRTRSEAERHRLLSELQQARADRDHSLERLPPVAQPSAAVSSGASSLEASFRDLCRPGWVIDRREVDVSNEIIGRGAYGAIRSGRWRGCQVAIKSIHRVLLSEYNRSVFEREMYIYSLLSHPHLLKCFGACTDADGMPMLILERMDCSLRSLLSAGPLSLPTVVTVARAVASALFYLHSLSPEPIVHRDLSSANVLLTSTPSASSFSITGVKLSDFGSAHFVQQCTTTVPGTPIYAAPEVLQSNGPAYLTKSDIYSLGVLLTEMCTGQQPAPERRAQQVRSVRSRNLRALADRCLSTDPAQRPSASAIVDFLDRLRQRMDSQIDHTRQ